MEIKVEYVKDYSTTASKEKQRKMKRRHINFY